MEDWSEVPWKHPVLGSEERSFPDSLRRFVTHGAVELSHRLWLGLPRGCFGECLVGLPGL